MRIKTTFQVVGEMQISRWEMINKLFEDVRKDFPGDYINERGFWEVDYGGHGSGFQKEVRQATQEEVKIWEAFRTIRDVCLSKTQ